MLGVDVHDFAVLQQVAGAEEINTTVAGDGDPIQHGVVGIDDGVGIIQSSADDFHGGGATEGNPAAAIGRADEIFNQNVTGAAAFADKGIGVGLVGPAFQVLGDAIQNLHGGIARV